MLSLVFALIAAPALQFVVEFALAILGIVLDSPLSKLSITSISIIITSIVLIVFFNYLRQPTIAREPDAEAAQTTNKN